MKIESTQRVTGFDASVAEAMAWIEQTLTRQSQVKLGNGMGLSENNPDDLVFIKRINRQEKLLKACEDLLNVAEEGSDERAEFEREAANYKLTIKQIKKTAFGVDRRTKAGTNYYTAGSFMAAVKEACEILSTNQPAWLNGQVVGIIGGSVDEEVQKFGIKRYTPKVGGKKTKQTTMDDRVAKLDMSIGYEEEEEEVDVDRAKAEEAVSAALLAMTEAEEEEAVSDANS